MASVLKKGSILKGFAHWNSVEESALRQRETILRNNGTISALGHSQSTVAENVLIVPRIMIVCKPICLRIASVSILILS